MDTKTRNAIIYDYQAVKSNGKPKYTWRSIAHRHGISQTSVLNALKGITRRQTTTNGDVTPTPANGAGDGSGDWLKAMEVVFAKHPELQMVEITRAGDEIVVRRRETSVREDKFKLPRA